MISDHREPRSQLDTRRFLADLLRHKASRAGLRLDKRGWAEVDELLRVMVAAGYPVDRGALEAIVRTDDKQRYAFSEDGQRIRASQGHSVPVDLGYKAKTPPVVLLHGTARETLAIIRKQGLGAAQGFAD